MWRSPTFYFWLSNKVNVKKHNSCKKSGDEPDVILAGIETTLALLASKAKDNFVVFFDENTMRLDEQNSPMIRYLAEF